MELDTNWKFQKGLHDKAFTIDFDDSKWETVTVPHDWASYGPFDKEVDKQLVAIVQNNENVASEKTGRTGALPYIGQGWYRNKFKIPQYKEGQKVLLLFEGAMSEPKVFVNGEKVGEWAYGYSYFYFDVTDQIVVDEEEESDGTLIDRGLRVIGDSLTKATQQVVVGEGVASLEEIITQAKDRQQLARATTAENQDELYLHGTGTKDCARTALMHKEARAFSTELLSKTSQETTMDPTRAKRMTEGPVVG